MKHNFKLNCLTREERCIVNLRHTNGYLVPLIAVFLDLEPGFYYSPTGDRIPDELIVSWSQMPLNFIPYYDTWDCPQCDVKNTSPEIFTLGDFHNYEVAKKCPECNLISIYIQDVLMNPRPPIPHCPCCKVKYITPRVGKYANGRVITSCPHCEFVISDTGGTAYVS